MIPPASLSTLAVMSPGPKTERKRLTVFQRPDRGFAEISGALSLGVAGYIFKSSSKQELARLIGEALQGLVCLPDAYRALRPQRAPNPAHDLLKRLHDLTPQQLR